MSGVMRSSWLTLLLTVALVAVSVVLAELIVRPAGGGQRAHLVVVLAAPALVAAALAVSACKAKNSSTAASSARHDTWRPFFSAARTS